VNLGVIITLVSVAFTVLITVVILKVVLGGLGKEQKENERIIQTGMPAQARILGLQHTGMSVAVMGHRHLRLGIMLEVHVQGHPPYQAQIMPLVSELYISSLQPGAFVEVRIDRANPMKIALAGPSAGPMQQPMGMQPGFGGAPMGMQPGVQPMGMGMGMAPGMGQQSMNRATRMVIIMMLVTTIPVAGILLAVFVDWSSLFGSDDAPKGGYCKAAARCCKVISGPAAAACEGLKDLPGVGCKDAWENYKQSAEAMGKSCK
jgi:hypothetical protein